MLNNARKCGEKLGGLVNDASRERLNMDLTLFLTNRCNLNCWSCFEQEVRFGRDQTLSLDEVQNFIDVTHRSGYHFESFLLNGGEATLHPEFDTIVKMLHESKLCDSITLWTNGTVDIDIETVKRINLFAVSNYEGLRKASFLLSPEVKSRLVSRNRTDEWIALPLDPPPPFDDVLPAICRCTRGGLALVKDRVMTCVSANSLMTRHGFSLDSHPELWAPLADGYADHFPSGTDRYSKNILCRYCPSNENVRKRVRKGKWLNRRATDG